MVKLILVLLAVGVVVHSGAGQAEEYTVSELIEIAVKQSRQIEAAGLEVQSKEMEARKATAWENPVLSLELENKREIEGLTHQWKTGLSQPLSLPGRFSLRGDLAESQVKMAQGEQVSTALGLKREVFIRAFSFLAAEEHAKHAQERLARFKDVQSYLRSRTFASPQKRAEAAIVSGKLLVLEKDLFNLKAEMESAWESLNLYLGFQTKAKLRANWYRRAQALSLADLSDKLSRRNPDLLRQRLVLAEAEVAAKLDRKERWPNLTLSGFYGDGSGAAPERTFGLGLAFPLPVFDSNRAGSEASRLRAEAEASRLRFVSDRTLLELKIAFLKYESASRTIERLSVERVSGIEAEMSNIDRGFRRGQIDLLTYIEADAQHSESLEAIFTAQTEFAADLSQLMVMIGESQFAEETQP